MKRIALGSLMAISFVFLIAAKSEGCGVQYEPGEGKTQTWDGGVVPTPVAAQPMTCAWLEEDNCWKRLVAKGKACAAGTAAQGSFTADRKSCVYPSQASWEFDGSIDTPSAGHTLFPIVNWRVLGPDGQACMTGKVLSAGRTTLDVQGEVALFESESLTKYRVTCPNGTTFANYDEQAPDGGTNVCNTFGAQWLAHRTPGVLMSCEGDAKRCKLDLWGGPAGETHVASCGW
jgi:hypothetical protein